MKWRLCSSGDECLFNVEVGGRTMAIDESGSNIALVTWNEMGDGGFHNAPRGKLLFMGGTPVSQWMLHH